MSKRTIYICDFCDKEMARPVTRISFSQGHNLVFDVEPCSNCASSITLSEAMQRAKNLQEEFIKANAGAF